ncbi:MAG TPA: Fic family protein [Candidatus Acidoferrales bacterium]|nr:Fic family protein [Candidatus Acidoferrales bacterium]
MPTVKKLSRGTKSYYYLEHSLREGGKVYKKRIYLGKSIPYNIAKLKMKLVEELYEEKWYGKFREIKANYLSALKKTPIVIRQKNLEAFMIQFTYDTQRIEGSKLTMNDTTNLLAQKITPKSASVNDIKEAERHMEVFYSMLKEKRALSMELILEWHKHLFSETKPEFAAKIRDYPVLISNTEFIPPKADMVLDMLEEFFDWYNYAKRTSNPVELAALVHLKFVTIHPFGDGNGRISRLIMNFVLNKAHYPMLDIRYLNRKPYYNALMNAQLEKDPNTFIVWLFRKYIKANTIYL